MSDNSIGGQVRSRTAKLLYIQQKFAPELAGHKLPCSCWPGANDQPSTNRPVTLYAGTRVNKQHNSSRHYASKNFIFRSDGSSITIVGRVTISPAFQCLHLKQPPQRFLYEITYFARRLTSRNTYNLTKTSTTLVQASPCPRPFLAVASAGLQACCRAQRATAPAMLARC